MSKTELMDEAIHSVCADHVSRLSRRSAHIFMVCVDGKVASLYNIHDKLVIAIRI
jgi:hypothetical protein